MNAWFMLARDLLMFRRSPADLPYSPTALVLMFVAMILLDAGAARALTGASGDPLLVALNNGVALLLVHGLLRVSGKSARFVQTATALLLIRVVLSALTLGLLAGILPMPEHPEDMRPLQAVLMAMSLPLFIWYLALRVHVLRHALDIVWPRALGLVLMIAAAEFVIALLLAQGLK